ncbi:MAG: DUF1553 domain-containing protein [Pirellulales bacterium]
MLRIAIAFCVLEALGAASVASADDGAAETFFRQRVATIFERRCVQCHSAAEAKGELRLDDAAAALSGGESGAVIDPGDPDASLLLDYISGDEPEMPKKGQPLSADEVAAVRKWIADGAKWPAELKLADKRFEGDSWWSLAPLAKPKVPQEKSLWIRTPVDAFVLESLEKHRLSPSPEADRRTLIRRLMFDLHGLPPTIEQVDAFVADRDPNAYEKLVDRLLDSPRYGERWGRHWLDAVHYGDTHGYDKDKVRPNAWPYRDYVIRSLNEGKPYARFVQEQLAGDVLFPGTADGIVATGFIAAGPWDHVGHAELREGTTDKAITRSLDRDDMLTTAMSTFTSLTVHCARCHNHKFDPIPQKDYYRLQAVFAGVERANRPYDADPNVAARRRELEELKKKLAARQSTLVALSDAQTTPELRAIDAQVTAASAKAAKAADAMPKAEDRTLGYHSQIEATGDVVKWVQVDLETSRPIEQVMLFPSHVVYSGHPGPGFGFPPRFKVEASNDAKFAEGVTVIADRTAADVPNPGDAPQVFAADKPLSARYVRLTATKLWERTKDYALAMSEIAVLSGGENVAAGKPVGSLDSIEAGQSWGRQHLVDGFFAESSFELAAATSGSPSNGYHSAIGPSADSATWVQIDLGQRTTLDEIVLVPARPVDFRDAPGFGFPVRFRIEFSDDPHFEHGHVVFDRTADDAQNPGDVPVRLERSLLGDATGRFVRVTATKLWERTNDYVFALAELQAWKGGRNLAAGATVEAQDSIEAGLWAKRYLVDGFSSRGALDGDKSFLARLVDAGSAQGELTQLTQNRDRLAAAAIPAALRAELNDAATKLAEVNAAIAALPSQQMVYAAASSFAPEGSFTPPPGGKPREIHLLNRGSVAAPGELVGPGTVQCVTSLESKFELADPDDEAARRAALAAWIVDRNNPLTWRSIVNRVWQYHFGAGIVATPNDFGRMGIAPTHPQLLDWLAVEFRDGDQSLKSLHKLLVTSAVYRQVSTEDEAKAKIDAGNRYLWRMNRRRLEAEAIRDATLVVAGKLDLSMGGPGFREFGFKDDHSPHYKYQEHDPDDPKTQRRSVYRFIVRSVPDPFMDTLDCADASAIVAKRNETVTALQALALLNNKFMLRMAEHFADRVATAGPDVRSQINAAFRLAFARDATEDELAVMAEYAEQYGMPNACRVILNLNEYVFVD